MPTKLNLEAIRQRIRERLAIDDERKRKFGDAPDKIAPVHQRIRERMAIHAERKRRFGNVRDMISTVYQGHRFLAVGNRLYFDKKWRTFTDFLLSYLRDVMGKQWWEEQRAKRPGERHHVMKWFDHWYTVSETAERDESGLFKAIPDGTMSALNLLAYDLYILRHHSKLQDAVLARLRQSDQFYGARYELFVAATFIRAGCDFEYEDEDDNKKKHAEFAATFLESKFKAAVEAKARQRKVSSAGFDVSTIRPGVRDLLLNAAEKATELPLIVFVELNLPPEESERPSWVAEVDAVIDDISKQKGGKSPFSAVIFTNRPHVYGQPGEPDPSRHVYAKWPAKDGLPDHLVEALGEAATKYGNVPTKFPDDFEG